MQLFKTTIIMIILSASLNAQKVISEIETFLINDTYWQTDGNYTGSLGARLKLAMIPLELRYQVDVYTPNKAYRLLDIPPSGEHPYAGFGYIGASWLQHYHDNLYHNKSY
jgi:hypothetical protein